MLIGDRDGLVTQHLGARVELVAVSRGIFRSLTSIDLCYHHAAIHSNYTIHTVYSQTIAIAMARQSL